MVTQITQRDVTKIVTRKLLHLALACLDGEVEGDSSSEEERRPAAKRLRRAPRIFDPSSMDGTCPSSAGSQRSRRSVDDEENAPSTQNSLVAAGRQSENASLRTTLRQRILAAWDALDVTDRDTKINGTIDRFVTLQHRDPASYRKAAQFVQVLRLVRETIGNGKIRQVRSLYYDNVTLFDRNQDTVKDCLASLSRFWQTHSGSFNILSGCRGYYAGPIWIERDLLKVVDGDMRDEASQETINNVERQSSPSEKHIFDYTPMLIEDPIQIKSIKLGHDIPWVVVVEKDTVFTERLQELTALRNKKDDNGGKGFGLLVTGRGYPDHTTRRFLLHLRDFLPETTRFYTLMDGDAYGMQISQSFHVLDHHNNNSSKPLEESLEWIGLRPSQWRRYLAILQMESIAALPFLDDEDTPAESSEEHDSSTSNAVCSSTHQAPLPSRQDYKTEACVSLDASEYQRAFAMTRRNDIPRVLQRELCKLIHLGFKLELEAAKHIPLHALLP